LTNRARNVYAVHMTTIVLIPGGGGNSVDWSLLVPLLEEHGFDVVSPDLPAADESAGIQEYADTVEAAIGDRTDLVVVSHSLGAFTAVELAERVPVRLLVFVAAMIPKPGETSGQWWDATGQSAAQRENDLAQNRDPDAPFDLIETFMHDVPEAVVERLYSEETPQSMRPFSSPNPGRAWRDVPSVAIAGAQDRLFPIDFMRRLSLERLGTAPIEIDAGHMVAVARPRELAEAIAAAVELTLAAAETANE
jgi:pimeloyl-ACP methyl ester carboxylesterase